MFTALRPLPGPLDVSGARDRLTATITAAPDRHRARHTRERAMLPAGVAVAAAAGSVVLTLGLTGVLATAPARSTGAIWTGPSGTTPGASPAAVQLLAKIAAAAAAQPNPVVRDSQFVYLKTWGAGSVCNPGGTQLRLPAGSRTSAYRKSLRAYRKSVHVAVPWDCVPGKPAEVQFWYQVSSLCATGEYLAQGRMTKFSFKAASADPEHFSCSGNMNYPTYRFMQTLPTDSHALLRLIKQTDREPRSGPESWYWAFFTIGELLYNAPPPPVTAALYRAAALIPGVTVVPDATDTIGRPGVAVAFTYQGMRTEWIFSKRTLRYLGSREVGIANGVLISQQAIQQHAIVDHAGQLPR
jgi:hypothetical protein